jgi:acyl-CoA synthetase (AMP-forming)/AMP-acid ligase II
MNIHELFVAAMTRDPDAPALVGGIGGERRELTYAVLNRQADSVCRALNDRGLRPGDRVLLAVPLSIETYVVMLGLLKAGMVIMFIDPAHGTRRVAGILDKWPPDAVVGGRSIRWLRRLLPALGRIPRCLVVGDSTARPDSLCIRAEPHSSKICRRSAADSALLTFTSGSTGDPKPVIRTHGFLRRQLEVLQPVARACAREVDFTAMPMFVLFNLANGLTSVIPACDMKNPGRADAETICRQLHREKANRMVASPALLERLERWCQSRGERLPTLRVVSTGGGPVSPSLSARFRRVAPNAVLRMVYGSTEAEPIAAIDDEQVSVEARRLMRRGAGLQVGRPVPGCQVRIIDPQQAAAIGGGNQDTLDAITKSTGDIGEIIVAGRHVLSSYADASRNRETKLDIDGTVWHRTGDAGYYDDTGCLWLVGRCSAVIQDDRGAVYPFQVEYALTDVAGIRRAALIGHQGRRLLVLETHGRHFGSGCDVIGQCVADHGIDCVRTVRRIPMDRRHNAKVDYPALRRLIEGRQATVRLIVVEVMSRGFRTLRRLVRRLRVRCQSTGAATTVDECHLKTD